MTSSGSRNRTLLSAFRFSPTAWSTGGLFLSIEGGQLLSSVFSFLYIGVLEGFSSCCNWLTVAGLEKRSQNPLLVVSWALKFHWIKMSGVQIS